MNSSHIQRQAEIVIGQGEAFDLDITVKDSTGTVIDISSKTVTNIKLLAFEFWDDTEANAKVTLTGSHITTGNGLLRFSFANATTSGLTPQTYLYNVEATIDGNKVAVIKDNLTILRSINT